MAVSVILFAHGSHFVLFGEEDADELVHFVLVDFVVRVVVEGFQDLLDRLVVQVLADAHRRKVLLQELAGLVEVEGVVAIHVVDAPYLVDCLLQVRLQNRVVLGRILDFIYFEPLNTRFFE